MRTLDLMYVLYLVEVYEAQKFVLGYELGTIYYQIRLNVFVVCSVVVLYVCVSEMAYVIKLDCLTISLLNVLK